MKTFSILILWLWAAVTWAVVPPPYVPNEFDTNSNFTARQTVTNIARAVVGQSNDQWILKQNGVGVNTTISNVLTLTGSDIVTMMNSNRTANGSNIVCYQFGGVEAWEQKIMAGTWNLRNVVLDYEPIQISSTGTFYYNWPDGDHIFSADPADKIFNLTDSSGGIYAPKIYAFGGFRFSSLPAGSGTNLSVNASGDIILSPLASTLTGFIPIQSGTANLLRSTNETDVGFLNVFTTGSNTIATFSGNIADYAQINVINSNTSAGASSDIVATAGDGTDTNKFVDFGINGPNGGQQPFTNGGHAYLYSMPSNNLTHSLNIGALGSNSSVRFYSGAPMVSGGVTNPALRMIIDTSGNVGIGTNTPGSALDVPGTGRVGGSILTNNHISTLGIGALGNPGGVFEFGGSTTFYSDGINGESTANGIIDISGTFVVFKSSIPIGWSSGSSIFAARDTALYRQSAGTVGGTNFYASGLVGIGTTSPGYKLHVAGDAYIPTNAAPFTVVSNAPAVLITNLNQRALLVFKLAFDDVTGGVPSCTVVATNLLSTNYFGTLSPTLSGLTLVGTVTITNDYSYPMQTNAIFKITDTSSGGAAVRVVQSLVFEQ